MKIYYNENDPKAAAWLKQLIHDGVIPAGDVDQRSILDVQASDLDHYQQCHFFAGIGGWLLALQLAAWPTERPVWTGSCPCQPFSVGNAKQSGLSDKRHLWPTWLPLIKSRKPPIIFGEQVASAIGKGWLDIVSGDLEGIDYSIGAAVLPACGYGKDHERKRLYWVANANSSGWEGYKLGNGLSGSSGTALSKSCDDVNYTRRAVAGNFEHLLQRDGVSVQMERDAIKGYGNAIVPKVAAEFIQASIEALT